MKNKGTRVIGLMVALTIMLGLVGCGKSDSATSGYAVHLTSGTNYASNTPATLRFDITNNGKPFNSFAVDSTKLMHLIVVRKDRHYFQHVHPSHEDQTGTFTLDNFQFPTDGQYRVFANFAPIGAKEDAMGMAETEAPYVDVNVGDVSKVVAQPLGPDNLTSAQNGLVASVVGAPTGGTIDVAISKDGVTFKALQPYLGNLGHMVVLGPNLEFTHAHPMGDVQNQSGSIQFMVTFPVVGQYKLYLQTQANDTVDTFDFTMTVKTSSDGH